MAMANHGFMAGTWQFKNTVLIKLIYFYYMFLMFL